MAKKKKNNTAISINPKKIHPSLKYGVPFAMLSLLAWPNFLISGILYYAGSDEAYPDPKGYVRLIFLIAFCFTIICWLFSNFEKLIKKYQIFTCVLIFLESLITILCMISLGLAAWIYDGNITSDDFIPDRVWSYVIPVIVLFIISVFSFTFYHQNMVVLKLSKGKVLMYPISLGSIVSSVILGRHITSSASNAIAVLIFALIGAGVIPGIAVGAIFCIIDLIRHPELKRYAN